MGSEMCIRDSYLTSQSASGQDESEGVDAPLKIDSTTRDFTKAETNTELPTTGGLGGMDTGPGVGRVKLEGEREDPVDLVAEENTEIPTGGVKGRSTSANSGGFPHPILVPSPPGPGWVETLAACVALASIMFMLGMIVKLAGGAAAAVNLFRRYTNL